ncbi:cupin domain-containing protein [Streptomyces sp. NBC_00083]|uniref:JmjC domain-containing protein n=1 Tax=Streptomyces sp. NBC_00083 TaxID=2975647 RepID=UPI0022534ED0|nr:cupin domain-containing protein [Streptomyces sp. NBC_00083]MCX5383750.1 cupin-like domain-containing protein [Streptomyces sp. NBC_00083]
MGDETPFLPGMSRELFFSEYFRRKPFVLRGVAGRLLEPALESAEFETIKQRMVREHPVQAVERPGEAWFIRVADLVSPRLAALSAAVRHSLDWPNVWCDTVQTLTTSGIGCHFDDSDNFVVQQQGTKRWQLSPPSGLPDESLRRRMLGDRSVGTAYMPDDALEFVLHPGDVLYLPIFWSHWGVSEGPSLSVSIALNSANALSDVLPLLTEELAGERAWWEPMPAGTPLDRLWAALSDPALRRRVEDAYRAQRVAAVTAAPAGGADPAPHDATTGPVTTGPVTTAPATRAPAASVRAAREPAELSFALGDGALRALLHAAPGPLDPAALLADPTREEVWGPAHRAHTRHVLLRVLRLLRHFDAGWSAMPATRTTAQAVIDALAAADTTELDALARHPVVLGAVRRAEHEIAADYRESSGSFVAQLIAAVLATAVRLPEVLAGRTVDVAPSEPHAVAVLSLGERWSAPAGSGAPAALRLDPADAHPLLRTADGAWHRARVAPLDRVDGSGLLLLGAHSWWDTAVGHGVSWHCGRPLDSAPGMAGEAADAVALLAECWPQARAAAESSLMVMAEPADAREWLDGRPTGLGPAPARALGLVTVLARSRWRTVTDLLPARDQPPPVTSPWDGVSRSAAWVCGQAVAARAQAEFARRLGEHGHRDAALTRLADEAVAKADEILAALGRSVHDADDGWLGAFTAHQNTSTDRKTP